MMYGYSRMATPAALWEQRELNRRMREQLDHEADKWRYFSPTAKEETMAKKTRRKTTRQRAAERREAREYAAREKFNAAAKERIAAAAERPAAASAAEKLATPPAAPQGDVIGIFLAHYFLEACGVTLNEQCNLFYCDRDIMRDRISTGRTLAHQRGLDRGGLAERARAMRENQWADGARKAAQAMLDRVMLSLPMALRSSYSDAEGVVIADVVRMVGNISVVDVVQVSDAAKKIAREPQPEKACDSSQPTGGGGGSRGYYTGPQTARNQDQFDAAPRSGKYQADGKFSG